MKTPTRKQLLDIWWGQLANWQGDPLPKSASARHRLALKFIDSCRLSFKKAVEAGNRDDQIAAVAKARWAAKLLIDATLGWSMDVPRLPPMEEEYWGADDHRLLLQMHLGLGTGNVLDNIVVDTAVLLLPNWLLGRLRDGLSALDEGEVHEIVKPNSSNKHDDHWSWNRMRLRAVQHVEFLYGGGLSKQNAEQRVQRVTGIAAGTLRKWSKTFNKSSGNAELVSLAFSAGKYSEAPGSQTTTGAMLEFLWSMEDEPLEKFARQYKIRYGYRHNQSSTVS